jgi:hypothetical protein
MFATITLGISIAGLIFLVGFKWWEERTGRLVLTGLRARVGEKVHAGVSLAKDTIPGAVARASAASSDIGRELAKRFLARTLLLSEAWLEKGLKSLRRAERMHRGGEASSFLQEVAEHKKQLVREREE